MEISGKIIQVLEEQSGQSAKGTWRKQQYILETEGQFPKKVCFMVWGDKIDDFAIKTGQEVEVSVDIESREFNGRWYTDVKAWKVSAKGTSTPSSDNAPMPDDEPVDFDGEDTDSGLPF